MARIIPQDVADELLLRLAQTDIDLVAGKDVSEESRLLAIHQNQMAVLATLASMNDLNPIPKASVHLLEEVQQQGTPKAAMRRIERVRNDFRERALRARYRWNDQTNRWTDPEDGSEYSDDGVPF